MDYKFIYLKNSLTKILFCAVALWASYELIDFWKYRMYYYAAPDDDPMDVTNKVWFNARKWLADGKYIRCDDKHLLISREKITFPLSNYQEIFITNLYTAMKKAYPALKDQSTTEFYEKIKETLSIEYMISQPDLYNPKNKPLRHSFLVSYIYNNTYFETELNWIDNTANIFISSLRFTTNKGEVFVNCTI